MEPAAVSKVGSIVITELSDAAGTVVSASASFSERSKALPLTALTAAPFGQALGACTVATLSEPTSTELIDEVASTQLPAGSAITVVQGPLQIAKLLRGEGARYHLDEAADTLGPTDLIVNVPGSSRFRSFRDVSVPVSAPVSLTSPVTELIVSSPFRWDPGSADTAVLLVGGDGSVEFSCLVPDTGSFEFSDEEKAQLIASGYGNGSLITAARVSLNTYTEGDSLLMISVVRLTAIDNGKTE